MPTERICGIIWGANIAVPMIWDRGTGISLASGAARFRDHADVSQVVLCSTDTDLFQCIRGDRVTCSLVCVPVR